MPSQPETTPWSAASWRKFPAAQQPVWPDADALKKAEARLTTLRDKSGADFDKAYVADQLETHSNALTLYGDYMLWGDYESLHTLAIKMIPITEAQLKVAQALAGD